MVVMPEEPVMAAPAVFLAVPSREVFWNVAGGWAVYVFLALLIAVLLYAPSRRLQYYLLGKRVNVFNNVPARLKNMVVLGLAQHRLPRDPLAAIMHACIFSSILVLTLVTAQVGIDHDILEPYFGRRLLQGSYYLVYSFYGDLFGVIGLIGVGIALYLRYFHPRHRLKWYERWEDHAILLGLGLVLLTGFLVEALRLAADELPTNPSWSPFSFAGFIIAWPIRNLDPDLLRGLHKGLWWTHVPLAFAWLALIGCTKLSHILLAPLNAFFKTLDPSGKLPTIPAEVFETAESFGAGKIQDLTWKQLFAADVCVRCGRCTAACPANIAGQPLSPMHIMQYVKQQVTAEGPRIVASRQAGLEDPAPLVALVGGRTPEDALWACRTCGACVQECPVLIEHIPTIIDQRRYLVMTEARLPDTAQMTLMNLEQRGHPWRGTQLTRESWMEGLGDVPRFDGSQEFLYWVGCTGALVDRNLPITRAVFKLLKAAGVSFGVLGSEETCTGDPARRLGHEYLYQVLAQQTIQNLQGHGVRNVITNCPHCFNTMKNEYPDFGGHFEVVHHTQFLAKLLREGKLRPRKGLGEKITYHDSCYLGRLNGVYEEPRKVLAALPNVEIVEMERSRSRSYCCGAGGGNMWLEEKGARRVNEVRAEEAVQTGATIVASNCPFCIQMFESALPTVDRREQGRMRAFDIAELLEVSVIEKPTVADNAAVPHDPRAAQGELERDGLAPHE